MAKNTEESNIEGGQIDVSNKNEHKNSKGQNETKIGRPISLMEEYSHVAKALEDTETRMRLRHHPTLFDRAPPIEVDDLKDLEYERQKKKLKQQEEQSHHQQQQQQQQPGDGVTPNVAPITASISENATVFSLRRLELKQIFAITNRIEVQVVPKNTNTLSSTFRFESILRLDVSHNELTDLPGLSLFKNLRTLDLNRNWFNTLPSEIGTLPELRTLIASRNFLRPNNQSLRLDALRESARQLTTLDLRYNQKCGRPFHRDKVRDELLPLTPTIQMTLWEELGDTPGTYVGSSAAVRDPILLRSQLEPLGTVALRKRLVCDFGRPPTHPSEVDRAGVMRDLLEAYFEEGMAYFPNNGAVPPASVDDDDDNDNDNDNDDNDNNDDNDDGGADFDALIADRTTLQLHGTPVPQAKLDGLLVELKKWTSHTGLVNKNRERPSIRASNYMILRRPKSREELAREEQLLSERNNHKNANNNNHNNANKNANNNNNKKSPEELAREEQLLSERNNHNANNNHKANNNANNNNKANNNNNKKSRRALRKAKKLERYRKLWELGISALRDVDPVFADQHCTEIAVTYGFSGSPHLDKQNCGPFYGLSLGTFDDSDGKGGIVVESSARVVVQVNTKHRLGRVDGRYVHWVKPWGGNHQHQQHQHEHQQHQHQHQHQQQEHQHQHEHPHQHLRKPEQSTTVLDGKERKEREERYSLIYYETGNDFVKPGPAVFSVPADPL
eukprot:CAMPEP_0172410836 /NCGR_PEP_ID=MMETSP1061-20121228/77088_1 /TAXON_ID=37318 /ORGANISM="Pseudo-nitzschia pungens, Strain cf. pungens" /LENGTH=729 /DNA_ID=CAMNT_0013147039 /DNA_START=129 /DNA_END=2317 /DNA_ORIENTATION=-